MTAKSAQQRLQAQQSRTATVHSAVPLSILAMSLLLWDAAAPRPSVQEVTPPAVAVAAPIAAPQPVAAVEIEPEARPVNSRHRALADFLAKRYKVSQAITLDLVTMAHAAGQEIGLDPLLILAVMSIESRFNPIAESVAGAKGLMQIIPKYHLDKFREFGGEQYAVFDPETNILVGARILKEYLGRTGTLNGALQMYVGNSSDQEDPYIGKVMTEKERLQDVLQRVTPRRHDVEASIAGERIALLEMH
jgi:soluble lytic murein transglycosylase-like protein